MALDGEPHPPDPAATTERLHRDEVARVLARAVELAAHDADGPDGVPLWVVEAAAAEVGVEGAAVARAVAELRAGMLPGDEPTDVGGAATVRVQRMLPLPGPTVLDGVGRFLSRHLFTTSRQRASEQRWRRRGDLLSGVQRAADVSGRLRLDGVREVHVRVAELEGGTVVRLDATLGSGWRHAGAWGAVPGAAVGAASVLVALTTGVPDVVAVGAAPAGAALAGAGWAAGRRALAARRRRVADDLEGGLDVVQDTAPDPVAQAGARLVVLARERWSVLRTTASRLPPRPPPPPPPPPSGGGRPPS